MKRTYVRVRLQMESSWRVGSWGAPAADVVGTLTDAADEPFVPGSSVAGALRKAAGGDRETLFGPRPGATKPESSPWWVLGTLVTGAEINERQRTRIDRTRGASAEKGLFRVEEVSGKDDAGSTVTIYLRREHEARDVMSEIIEPLLKVLRSWQPRIGGGRSIGMGKASITEVRHRTLDLDRRDDLLAALTADGTPIKRVDELLAAGECVPTFEPDTQTYLKAKVQVGFLAVTSENADRISGSTWKGLLRSRVEFIGRSLGHEACGAPCWNGSANADWTGCGECAVCRVFGSSRKPGIWSFNDSVWTGGDWTERQRIAIDRFTGGVRDGALWPQQYRPNVTMTLTIDGTAPAEEDHWVHAALLHALRDLDDGLIAVGPEGAAGYGTTRITELVVNGQQTELTDLGPVPLPGGEEAIV